MKLFIVVHEFPPQIVRENFPPERIQRRLCIYQFLIGSSHNNLRAFIVEIFLDVHFLRTSFFRGRPFGQPLTRDWYTTVFVDMPGSLCLVTGPGSFPFRRCRVPSLYSFVSRRLYSDGDSRYFRLNALNLTRLDAFVRFELLVAPKFGVSLTLRITLP